MNGKKVMLQSSFVKHWCICKESTAPIKSVCFRGNLLMTLEGSQGFHTFLNIIFKDFSRTLALNPSNSRSQYFSRKMEHETMRLPRETHPETECAKNKW